MQINTDNLISITEANQNFSKVARTVDTQGSVVIMKNNVPRYLILDFKKFKRNKLYRMKMSWPFRVES